MSYARDHLREECGVVALGRILRFDDVRGYGFVAPANGGEDVFVHANDFGEQRYLVRPGLRVEFEAEESDRGPKVSTIRIVGPPDTAHGTAESHDDDVYDVLSRAEFDREVTDLLIQHVPTLTGAQIVEIRKHLAGLAQTHAWIEA
jgi:CspA family cold shock protein